MKKHLRIFSLGGNEVSPMDIKDPKTGKPVIPDIRMQWQRTAETVRMISNIIEKFPNDSYILTHGNGPQVGNILLRAEYCRPILHPLPLDICGADSQGAMSYMLAQLSSELQMRGLRKVIAGTVTQVVVNPHDPDFKNPSKFIGNQYTYQEAMDRHTKDGWQVKLYGKDKEGKEIWRRVVPSPEPIDILEIDAVENLIRNGLIPVTVGGGGIPVMAVEPRIENGEEIYQTNYGIIFRRPHKAGQPTAKVYAGVDAVIDKDFASALLGKMLIDRAKARGENLDVSLTIFTAEDGVKLNYKKSDQKNVRHLTLAEARKLLAEHPEDFPAGSMGPKMKAVLKFMEAGGSVAHITKTALFEKTLTGQAGTTFVP